MSDGLAAASDAEVEPTQVGLLRRESRLLVSRLRLWAPPRFAAAAPPWGTRGDLVHHLAQHLADLAADTGGTPRRTLPRLDSDLAVPDQLAVTADDLVRTLLPPQVAVRATAHLLAHRTDLLQDEVPNGLAVALGLDDPVAIGRKACHRDVAGIVRN